MTILNGAEGTPSLEHNSERLRTVLVEFTSGAEREFLVDKVEISPRWFRMHIHNGGTINYPMTYIKEWWERVVL